MERARSGLLQNLCRLLYDSLQVVLYFRVRSYNHKLRLIGYFYIIQF